MGRNKSHEFVAFLTSVVETQPRRREIHIIVDNLSAQKTQKVRTFLVAQPNVRLHYTPTYSSWLNQIELWFSKIERDVIARGVFTSVTDLRRKLMRPVGLRRSDEAHRMTAVQVVRTVHSQIVIVMRYVRGSSP
jgi:transposase